LASQALALSNKEAMLQEKEKAQSLALDTLYDIKTQKSQLEIARKLLTHSEKELQWHWQFCVA
jgi:hypothetical protein